MRKTFCDRGHAAECTSRIGRLHLSVVHQTNKGEIVSEDDYRTMDLCGECLDELLATFLAGKDPLPIDKTAFAEDTEMAAFPERALVTSYPTGERDE